MTIDDLYIRDEKGRAIALVAENPELRAAPLKLCPHGSICPACSGGSK